MCVTRGHEWRIEVHPTGQRARSPGSQRAFCGLGGMPDLRPRDLSRTSSQISFGPDISIAQPSVFLGHAKIARAQRDLGLDLTWLRRRTAALLLRVDERGTDGP